jgi:hypothetical protein
MRGGRGLRSGSPAPCAAPARGRRCRSRGRPGLRVAYGPAARDQLAMPAQQRYRRRKERRPRRHWQRAAQRGQQQPVGRPQPRAADLTLQDMQLMAQHKDLELLRPLRSAAEVPPARTGAGRPKYLSEPSGRIAPSLSTAVGPTDSAPAAHAQARRTSPSAIGQDPPKVTLSAEPSFRHAQASNTREQTCEALFDVRGCSAARRPWGRCQRPGSKGTSSRARLPCRTSGARTAAVAGASVTPSIVWPAAT